MSDIYITCTPQWVRISVASGIFEKSLHRFLKIPIFFLRYKIKIPAIFPILKIIKFFTFFRHTETQF